MPRTPLPAYIKLVRDRKKYINLVRETPTQVSRAADIAKLLAHTADEEVEVVSVISLDNLSRVIGITEVTRGLINTSLIHPREVFRTAIAQNAASIIISHNHPSGDPTPSEADRVVTRQLVNAGRLLDIPVYDHVIIGTPTNWTSFADKGLL